VTERIAYFECIGGASGDMILGALLDAGLDLAALNRVLERLPLRGLRVRAESVSRGALRALQAIVECPPPDEPHGHRSFADIRRMLAASSLEAEVKERSIRVFTRLAEAEGKVHGVGPDEVTFHEVGAADSIADVVGAVAGLRLLGFARLHVSAFPLGEGFVECAHGRLPLPAPATVELLRGFVTYPSGAPGEKVTPTGAAILTTLAEASPPPPFRLEAVGYGAGTADRPDGPNVLRLLAGRVPPDGQGDRVWVLETNLDDTTPEVVAHTMDVLLAEGALDVFAQPVQMKKGRPGVVLTCLAGDGDVARLEGVLFRETTTFGVRKHPVDRVKLQREQRTVETPYGSVRVKVGRRGGDVMTISPEYEDCRRLASARGVPLRRVYDAASRAAQEAS